MKTRICWLASNSMMLMLFQNWLVLIKKLEKLW
jgi:hypothetical protein